MVQQVLMVAEKPSIAEALAKSLCKGKYNSRRGASPVSQVHEFNGDFQGSPAWIKITSVAGHVYTIDFPPELNNWDRVDPAKLFESKTIQKEANPKQRMPQHLRSESKGCNHLVLWLDCDREGENICFEVMQNVVPQLPDRKNVWRAKFSSLVAKDLQHAYHNLGYPNKNEALSVDARQEIDLKTGVAFTRFQTRYFQGKYGDLDSSLVSYGPCQTPTLWFCVRRHNDIQTFQPETYYTMDVKLEGSQLASPLWLEWARGQLFDLQAATTFKSMIDSHQWATVTDVSEKEERRSRPGAMNTVLMLKLASQQLGMGPQQAMQVAERLYLSGYITYPRTETTKYPPAFDLREAVSFQTRNPYWGEFATELLTTGLNRPKEGYDAGDHPPITPVRSATEGDFGSSDSWRLFDMLTRHFLATLSHDCKFTRTKVHFTIGDEKFSVSGRRMKSPGFTRVQYTGEMQDIYVPPLRVGEKLQIASKSISSAKTKPPPYLSESDLLGLMEKNGIGTDASMATHINNICERNYVSLTDGRRLVPTKLGIALVHGYQAIDNELVIPRVRANIESECTLIANGKARKDEVTAHALTIFQQKFMYFVAHVDLMDHLFESTFTSLAATGKLMSRCGKCRTYMNLIDKKPVRLFCRHCDETYALPQTGSSVKLYKELTCPLDNFQLVMISYPATAGGGRKQYPLCPMCYNDPPFPESKPKSSCWECLHPTCRHALASVGVCGCPQDACSGTLCLDAESKPKWKLDCNICNYQLRLFQDKAHKISVTKDKCESCGSKLLSIEFNKGKSPLPDAVESITGCLVCDEALNSQVESSFARLSKRHGGGKGKGGRRGKGRGGKRANVDVRMTFDGF
ncbi:DNA topoisomerase 3-beta-1 [Perkinsus olseni]|uniref:DNA topoisomerase n=1 Tax=Perkinsus olseni TaxID=32597 RepID=A0A7J6MP43_PEROL|nr:DNA topoisomerase 3-beta-1 [Perkinsus olseni]